MDPDSLRSESWGRRSVLCSGARLSWLRATTGTSSSRARALSPREISLTSWTRLSTSPMPGHELHVVDDQHAQVGFGLEPSGLGPHLQNGGRRGIVDPEGSGIQVPGRGRQPLVLVGGELPPAQALAVDPALGTEQPLDQLLLPHLQGEDGDGDVVLDGGGLGHVQDPGGLPHGGAGRNDAEFALLKPRGHPVEVRRTPSGTPVIPDLDS